MHNFLKNLCSAIIHGGGPQQHICWGFIYILEIKIKSYLKYIKNLIKKAKKLAFIGKIGYNISELKQDERVGTNPTLNY